MQSPKGLQGPGVLGGCHRAVMARTHEGMKGMVSEEARSWQEGGPEASRREENMVSPASVAFPPGSLLEAPSLPHVFSPRGRGPECWCEDIWNHIGKERVSPLSSPVQRQERTQAKARGSGGLCFIWRLTHSPHTASTHCQGSCQASRFERGALPSEPRPPPSGESMAPNPFPASQDWGLCSFSSYVPRARRGPN